MNKRTDVTIDYQFIVSWNNFFLYQQLHLLKQISQLQNIPFLKLLHYLPNENKWEQKLPICIEKQRCIARIYNKGYGGRCIHKFASDQSCLCRIHEREFNSHKKCQFGTVSMP